MKDVKVVDSEGQVLFECSVENIAKAYDYSLEMEKLGIDVRINAPSLPETLAQSLGTSDKNKQNLRDEIFKEIDSHNSPECCGPETPLH